MGQAKRRGSFEERKAKAVERKVPAQVPPMVRHQFEPVDRHRTDTLLATIYGLLLATTIKPRR